MHEMAVIAHVIDTLDAFADKNHVKEIQTVVLQVGAMSGVIPKFVRECWEPAVYFSKHMKHAVVEIENIPAIGKCLNCGEEYDIQAHEGLCPQCGLQRWTEISGSELIIKEVRIAEADIIQESKPEELKNG